MATIKERIMNSLTWFYDGLKSRYLNPMETKIDEIDSKIYPVGSIYISINDTNPADLFGGTWEQIENRFLLAAGSSYSVGSTGGSSTVTLTSSQMPSHTHSLPSHTHSTPSHTHSIPALSGTAATAGSHRHGIINYGSAVASGSNYRRITANGDQSEATLMEYAGDHTHTVTTTASTTGSSSGTSGSTSGTSGSTGSGSSHENMPPYLTVYMWQRVA